MTDRLAIQCSWLPQNRELRMAIGDRDPRLVWHDAIGWYLPDAIPSTRLSNLPVAWRVKDFADGWIIFQDEAVAIKYAEEEGSLIQGLYVRDGT